MVQKTKYKIGFVIGIEFQLNIFQLYLPTWGALHRCRPASRSMRLTALDRGWPWHSGLCQMPWLRCPQRGWQWRGGQSGSIGWCPWLASCECSDQKTPTRIKLMKNSLFVHICSHFYIIFYINKQKYNYFFFLLFVLM